MTRIIRNGIAWLLFFLLIIQFNYPTALCEQTAWNCPECGRVGNTGNYCGGCGHPAPWLETKESSLLNPDGMNEPAIPPFKYRVLEDGSAEIVEVTIKSETIIIPDQIDGYRISSIGTEVFSAISTLETVILPQGIESIGKNAFSYCNNLKKINLPDSVIQIGAGAFSYCRRLETIVIPNKVQSIPDVAFMNCSQLRNVILPQSTIFIGKSAFSNTDVQSIIIPEETIIICDSAFFECRNLMELTIPSTVVSIEKNAFSRCTNLKEINIINNEYARQYFESNPQFSTTSGVMMEKITDIKAEYISEKSISLGWKACPHATSYKVLIKTEDGSWKLVKQVYQNKIDINILDSTSSDFLLIPFYGLEGYSGEYFTYSPLESASPVITASIIVHYIDENGNVLLNDVFYSFEPGSYAIFPEHLENRGYVPEISHYDVVVDESGYAIPDDITFVFKHAGN